MIVDVSRCASNLLVLYAAAENCFHPVTILGTKQTDEVQLPPSPYSSHLFLQSVLHFVFSPVSAGIAVIIIFYYGSKVGLSKARCKPFPVTATVDLFFWRKVEPVDISHSMVVC